MGDPGGGQRHDMDTEAPPLNFNQLCWWLWPFLYLLAVIWLIKKYTSGDSCSDSHEGASQAILELPVSPQAIWFLDPDRVRIKIRSSASLRLGCVTLRNYHWSNCCRSSMLYMYLVIRPRNPSTCTCTLNLSQMIFIFINYHMGQYKVLNTNFTSSCR